MSLPLLTAVTPQYESQLTTRLGGSRAVHVVRRCADLAELLGAAAAGIARVAVISAELRGLDRAAIQQLTDSDLLVLGVHRPSDETGQRTLRRWGVAVVLPADADQAQLDGALAELAAGDASGAAEAAQGATHGPSTPPRARASRDPDQQVEPAELESRADPRLDLAQGSAGHRVAVGEHGSHHDSRGENHEAQGSGSRSESAQDDDEPGRVVVVWGPVGAPGRTTVAVHTAAELAERDASVILADLDTYGASVAQVLAVLDEAPGVAAAARAADQGTLDHDTLNRLALQVAPGLRVLTGMPRPDRWPELRENAVRDVLTACTDLVPLTVVDVGFCLESDEELTFDTIAPRRNGAALAALEVADHIVVVGSADPVGLQRLVRGLDQLSELTAVRVTVVVNRVRPTAVGRDPGARIRDALQRFAGLEDIILVAEDQSGLDAAVLAGRTLREARPASPARTGLRAVASRVAGRALPAAGRRRRTRRTTGVR